jgi:hypothetical protein
MSEQMPHAEEAMVVDVKVTVGEPIGVGEGAIHTDLAAEEARQLAELLPTYLVAVTEDAPGSCIDGRDCVECLDGQSTEARYSVAGGPLITAYAMAVMTGWFGEKPPAELAARLTMLQDVLNVAGIRPGAHVDQAALAAQFINHETGTAKTGCGADDKAARATELSAAISRASADGDETGNALFRAFMDEAYDARKLGELENQAKVAAVFLGWDPRASLDVTAGSDTHAVEVLAADNTPMHGHAEALAVIVKVEGYTVDQKALLRDTGKQVFVIDVPYIRRIAKALATGPQATEQYEALYHAAIAYQLGTYAALCDGSQYPAVLEGVSSAPQASA